MSEPTVIMNIQLALIIFHKHIAEIMMSLGTSVTDVSLLLEGTVHAGRENLILFCRSPAFIILNTVYYSVYRALFSP